MWPKFGNCIISMKEVILTSILYKFDQKIWFFWFKFNNLGHPLGVAWNFYSSVARGLKLKVRKFLGLVNMLGEATGEKLVGGLLAPHPE